MNLEENTFSNDGNEEILSIETAVFRASSKLVLIYN